MEKSHKTSEREKKTGGKKQKILTNQKQVEKNGEILKEKMTKTSQKMKKEQKEPRQKFKRKMAKNRQKIVEIAIKKRNESTHKQISNKKTRGKCHKKIAEAGKK